MTLAASQIADALRWVWLGVGAAWIVYAWRQRIEYRIVLWSLVGLVALDWLVHWIADFVERPNSGLPSDFALYSLMMLSAAAAGLLVACAYARWRGTSLTALSGAALFCIIAGAVAGRAQYVWMNWDYFAENTDLINDLSVGGMSWRGAFIIGLVALILCAFLFRQSFWQLADAAALGLALASSIAWYGAHLTHLYYGISIEAAPPAPGIAAAVTTNVRAFGFNFVQDLPDAYNVIALRIPVQLISSLFFITLFMILLNVALREKSRSHDGSTFLVYLTAASAASFLFGFWRGDATWVWNGLRADQWLDLALLLLALVLGSVRKRAVRQHARATQTALGVMQHA